MNAVGWYSVCVVSLLVCPFNEHSGDNDVITLQVVANAVAAISEIIETSQTAAAILELNSSVVNKMLTALNECSESVLASIDYTSTRHQSYSCILHQF